MDEFDVLVEFVKRRFPSSAIYLSQSGELAVDGRIFRNGTQDGLIFKDENGEQVMTLADCLGILEEDLRE